MTSEEGDGNRRVIVAAFLANLGIAVAKMVGFVFTGAASMLAEGVHSLADTANQGLLLLGRSRARRPATAQHPFGHGRERYFWAFVVALVIFSLGSLFALFEGVEKLRTPHALESTPWAIAILLVAAAFEGVSFRTAVRESTKVKGDQTWWGFVHRAKGPELPVVLLEDFGALIGLLFALAGVCLAAVTGNSRFDAVGSVAIGVLLGAIAATLAVEMKSLLIGEAASPVVTEEIRRRMAETPSVRRVVHLRTEHLGPEELLVAAKLEFDTGLDVIGLASAIDDVEASVRDAVPSAHLIYIEPGLPTGGVERSITAASRRDGGDRQPEDGAGSAMDENDRPDATTRRSDRLVGRADRLVESGRLTEQDAERLRSASDPDEREDAMRAIRVRHAAERLDAAVADGRLTRQEADGFLERMRNGEHSPELRAQLGGLLREGGNDTSPRDHRA